MGYAELFAYHVMPITRSHRDPDGNYVLGRGRWVGTGFTFGEGTFVTCWHCVAAALSDNEVYIAVGRREGLHQASRDWPIELHRLAQDRNGSDLALATIGPMFQPRLNLASDPLEWGDDVVAFGFLSHPRHDRSRRRRRNGSRLVHACSRVTSLACSPTSTRASPWSNWRCQRTVRNERRPCV